MASKVNLNALTAAGNALRFALASYLKVAVDYRLISRIEADEMISAPDRAFPVFSTVEKALSTRRRQGAYMDQDDEPSSHDEPAPRAKPAVKPKAASKKRG